MTNYQKKPQIWVNCFARRDFKTKQIELKFFDAMPKGSFDSGDKDQNGSPIYIEQDVIDWIRKSNKPLSITIMPNDKNGNPLKTNPKEGDGSPYYKMRIMEKQEFINNDKPQVSNNSDNSTSQKKTETSQYVGEKPPF